MDSGGLLIWTDRVKDPPRVKVVLVAGEFLADLMTVREDVDDWSTFQIREGLPKGSKLVRVSWEHHSIALHFEHESFPPVEPGSAAPKLLVLMARSNGQCDRGHPCPICKKES